METTTQFPALQLGDTAPNFSAMTTEGEISFHERVGDHWCIFFSHPRDYTPVCTTELGEASRCLPEFEKRKCKIIGLSVDPLSDHEGWIEDINETQRVKVNFPIIADHDRKIALQYGMIHPKADDTFTVRTVFIIDPNKIVRLMMTYPAATGRNFKEILRVLDALQLTTYHDVATPVNWQEGDDCIILPSITDPEELKQKFPRGWKELKPYLRITPSPK